MGNGCSEHREEVPEEAPVAKPRENETGNLSQKQASNETTARPGPVIVTISAAQQLAEDKTMLETMGEHQALTALRSSQSLSVKQLLSVSLKLACCMDELHSSCLTVTVPESLSAEDLSEIVQAKNMPENSGEKLEMPSSPTAEIGASSRVAFEAQSPTAVDSLLGSVAAAPVGLDRAEGASVAGGAELSAISLPQTQTCVKEWCDESLVLLSHGEQACPCTAVPRSLRSSWGSLQWVFSRGCG